MMRNKDNRLLIIAVLFLFLTVCIISICWIGFSDKNVEGLQLLADIGKYIEGEPTPFQPFQITATPLRDIQPITGALVPNPGLVPP